MLIYLVLTDGSTYKITSTLTLFVTYITISTNPSRLTPTIACWTLRFVILPFVNLMVTAFSGTEEAYSTYARHLTINLVQWTQHNKSTKAFRWKWPWAILTNLPLSDINVTIAPSTQCSTWALCYRVSHHVSIHSSSLPMCSISLILYWVDYLQAKNHQLPTYVLKISKTGHFIFLGGFQPKPAQIPCTSCLLSNIQTSSRDQPASSRQDWA